MEARTSKAAELLAQGHSCTVVTNQVAEIYELNRRQARRICAAGMGLIVKDFDDIQKANKQKIIIKKLVRTKHYFQKELKTS